MKRVKAFYKLILREPLWSRMVVGISLLASIVLSGSAFSLGGYAGSVAKLAAAILFGAFGMNMRQNRRISLLFFALAVLPVCIMGRIALRHVREMIRIRKLRWNRSIALFFEESVEVSDRIVENVKSLSEQTLLTNNLLRVTLYRY